MYSNHRNLKDYDKLQTPTKSICLSWINMGMEVWFHLFLRSALDAFQSQASQWDRFTPQKFSRYPPKRGYCTGIRSDGLTEYFAGSNVSEFETINKLLFILNFLNKNHVRIAVT